MINLQKHKKYLIVIGLALVLKLALFLFAEITSPQSKFLYDSTQYLDIARSLAEHFQFASRETGVLKTETFRTPGYPFFLAIFHNILKIPLAGINLIQIAFVGLAALLTFKIASSIDPALAFLSTAIVLLDPPLSIFSVMILSETLFLFFITCVVFLFIMYLKTRQMRHLLCAALAVAVSIYVRPIAYYLGIALAAFIVYANFRVDCKKALFHAFVFFMAAYLLAGAWQVRNHVLTGHAGFSAVAQFNLDNYSLLHNYVRYGHSSMPGVSPFVYYANVIARSFLAFMTSPGSLKYFNNHGLVVAGKVLAYPWMVFWLSGFIVGILKIGKNIYFQALMFIASYFILISVAGVTLLATDRFRMPIVPCLAILSAYGWSVILKGRKERLQHEKF